MSVKYTPVQWNSNKYWYDFVLVGMVFVYILSFLTIAQMSLDHARPIDGPIVRARAFGTCAFLLLIVILCIGPLAHWHAWIPVFFPCSTIGYLGVFLLGATALFISRFWLWSLPWSPKGLWGIQALSPNGDVLRRVLRGTPLEAFGLVIWMGLILPF